MRTPHTGALQYTSDVPKIPAAAITTEDADRLQRMADRGSRIVVRLKMEAHFEADATSANDATTNQAAIADQTGGASDCKIGCGGSGQAQAQREDRWRGALLHGRVVAHSERLSHPLH